jgi:hypothetical protein
MKLNLICLQLLLLTIIFSYNGYAQNNFQEGYFVKNNGEEVSCFIKNENWVLNPEKFFYKISENSRIEQGNIDSVSEFVIFKRQKYIRKQIQYDISSDKVNDLSSNSAPNWKTKTVFLKVLVEGFASLYYNENILGSGKYFYNLNDDEIKQLIYKRYTKKYSGLIYNNNAYKQTLMNTFSKCSNLSLRDFENLNYINKDLVYLFIKYNKCINKGSIKSYNKDFNKANFNLRLKVGANIYSSVKIANSRYPRLGAEFGGYTGMRVGLEGEVMLLIKGKNFSVFIEAARVNGFIGNDVIDTPSITRPTQEVILTYDNYFEFPVGIRYYITLNDKFKLSFQGGLAMQLSTNFELLYEISEGTNNNDASQNIFFGASIHYNRFAFETKFNLENNIVDGNSDDFTSKASSFSLSLVYNLF